jgi:hypothetical protein
LQTIDEQLNSQTTFEAISPLIAAMGKTRISNTQQQQQQHAQQPEMQQQQQPAAATAGTAAASSEGVAEGTTSVTESPVKGTSERSLSDTAHVQVNELPLEDRRASMISHIRELAHAQRYVFASKYYGLQVAFLVIATLSLLLLQSWLLMHGIHA